jgi:hypothetical protein
MRHRSRTGIPVLAEKRGKFPAIDQLDIAPFSKRDRILGKSTRCHHISASGMVCGHDPIQFTDDSDAHLLGAPLLALNKEAFVAARKNQINAAIGSCSAFFGDLESTLPKSFSDKILKLLPG